MFASCELKRQVLDCVYRLGMATSSQVAAELGPYAVSKENVSMALLKCKNQGLVDREEFKQGRVRGYVYWLLERGKKRLLYYSSRARRGRAAGTIDIKRVVKDVRRETAPLYYVASTPFDSEDSDEWQRKRKAYLFLDKHRIISAFASEKILNGLLPDVSEAVGEASKEMTIDDILELGTIMRKQGDRALFSDEQRLFILLTKINDLQSGLLFVYREWQEEQSRSERLEHQLEEERRQRRDLEAEIVQAKRTCLHLTKLPSVVLSVPPTQAISAMEATKPAYARICMNENVKPPVRKSDPHVRSTIANILPIIAITFAAAVLLFALLCYLYRSDIQGVLLGLLKILRLFVNCL